MKNLKSFIILPLVPIIAYILIDMLIKDEKISLMIALCIGVLEFIVTTIINKKPDFFILVDLLLLIMLGGISILFNNPLFFLFKPAVVEGVLLILMVIFTIYPDIYSKYMKRFIKRDIKVQTDNFKTILIVFDIIIMTHIILIVVSALFADKTVWGFVSTILLYILFFAAFLVIFLVNIIKRNLFMASHKNEEWFDILDESGRIIGSKPRSLCHNGSMLLHPVVHIHITDGKGRLLLQKRSLKKDIQPGKWDTAVGGHISSGEKLETAFVREAKEELGIDVDISKAKMLGKYIFQSSIERELVFSFLLKYNGKFDFANDEVDDARFFEFSELEKLIKQGDVTENFSYEFKTILHMGGGRLKLHDS